MLLLAAGIAAAALALFARMTGWAALAARFPLATRPAGAKRSGGVVIGPWGWNAPPLRVALDEVGIALAPTAPFRPFFQPLRIPWAAVTGVERREYMFFDVVRLRCGDDAVIGFLPSAVTTAIEARLAGRAGDRGLTDRFRQPKTSGP